MTRPVVAAVDVGGTTMKGGVVDGDGTVLARLDRRVADVVDGNVVGAVLAHLRAVVDLADDHGGAVAMGLAVPGLVDEAAGVGRHSLILGWRDVPFVELLAETRLPLAFGHDVASGAYAEARLGAARGHTDWLFVALGTGVGSTFVLGDRPYKGARGDGGEFAHVLVQPGGRLCRCGRHGCLETVASGPAIAAAYVRAGGTGSDGAGAAGVARRALAGDPVAQQVWDDAADALADAVAAYAELMDPSVVVVGGGVAGAGALLVERLDAGVRDRVRYVAPPRVVAARLGADAALLGVAARAHELVAEGARYGVPFVGSAPAPRP